MSSGYCTKLGTEHCSIIRIVLCGTTFTLLKKRCQCFVDAPMLRSHRRQRPLTDNKEKPQPHYKMSRNLMLHFCCQVDRDTCREQKRLTGHPPLRRLPTRSRAQAAMFLELHVSISLNLSRVDLLQTCIMFSGCITNKAIRDGRLSLAMSACDVVTHVFIITHI